MAIDHDCSSGAICESVDRGCSFAVMMQSAPHRDTRSIGLHTPKQIIVTLDPAYHQCAFIGLDLSRPYQRSATMVKDATADYPDKEMHADLDINIPNYASAVVTTNQVVEALSFHQSANAERFERLIVDSKGGAQEFRRYSMNPTPAPRPVVASQPTIRRLACAEIWAGNYWTAALLELRSPT